MTDRLNIDNERSSLPKYDNIGQVIFDLEKMQRLYLNRAGVKELSTYMGTRTIRIPAANAPFSERVAEIVHHELFFRLNNVLQLGFTHYVFPGATHTRLEHSLGVFANVSNYINSLLSDDSQPYFRQLADPRMIVTTLLAGLLHDIGQHSFSHSLEDLELTQKHTATARMFITGEGLSNFANSGKDREPLKDLIISKWPEVDIDVLCWLISEAHRPEHADTIGWDIAHDILSGPVDVDKTDLRGCVP